MQAEMRKILSSVLSMILSFLTGVGFYYFLQNNKPTKQLEMRPPLENVEKEQKYSFDKMPPKKEKMPRPRLGDGCPTCGMG